LPLCSFRSHLLRRHKWPSPIRRLFPG
jgi:hypothetical protein